MTRISRFAIPLLCAALACTTSGSTESEQPGPKAEPSGDAGPQMFPPFTLPNLEGDDVSLEDFRGSVVLVVFWATWCPPCVAEVPALNRLWETYADSGFSVLAVAVDPRESEEKILRFVRDKNVRYPVLLGSKDTGRRYQVRGIPTSYLVGTGGEVLQQFIGYAKEEIVEEAIISALGL